MEEALRNLSNFQAAVPTNDEKIDQVIAVGRDLANRGVFPVEKILAKCDQLEQRYLSTQSFLNMQKQSSLY